MIGRSRGGRFRCGLGFHSRDSAHDRQRDIVYDHDVEWSKDGPRHESVQSGRAIIVKKPGWLVPEKTIHLPDAEAHGTNAKNFLARANAEVNGGDMKRPAGLVD